MLDIQEKVSNKLTETFTDYLVKFSDIVCELNNCTNGNKIIIEGKVINFKKFLSTRSKILYWSF